MDDNSYSAAGFVSNSSTPTGAVTSGFRLYGTQVTLLINDTLLAQFWAKKTATENIWSLIWNKDGSVLADSTPVVIKTTGLP